MYSELGFCYLRLVVAEDSPPNGFSFCVRSMSVKLANTAYAWMDVVVLLSH